MWEPANSDMMIAVNQVLEELKGCDVVLFVADEIFVINVGGYIGQSTRSEIEYALRNGKTVKYLEEA